MKIILLPGLDGTGILYRLLMDVLQSSIESLVIEYPSNVKGTKVKNRSR